MDDLKKLPATGITKDKIRGALTCIVVLLAINGALPIIGKNPFGTWSMDAITNLTGAEPPVADKKSTVVKESVEGK